MRRLKLALVIDVSFLDDDGVVVWIDVGDGL